MCGIAGVVGLRDGDAAMTSVGRMVSTLARRGPDGEGSHSWDGATFGHRRLAIFDLSDAGKQPMVTPDGAIGVVFNGAIYNYRELRQELVADGFSFVSQTDTEVLLHGYRRWGVDELVRRLRGMFAFALWDDRGKRLFLVRDRLGVKPLVYATGNGVIAFASTVRALAAAGYAGEVDPHSVAAFLEHGFLADDRCIYRGIQKIPASSILEWADGKLALRTYWRSLYEPSRSGISFVDAVAEARDLLLEAVKIRLHADVPVGALLSGGIDSSLVCWAVRELGSDVQAYTVGTPGDTWDETAQAKETARALGLRHSVVEMSEDDTPDVDDVVSAYAEPFGTTSALGMLRVCRAISRSSNVKVLLTGDGGDDVFLGYPRYRNFWIASHLSRRLPRYATRLWQHAHARVPTSIAPLRRAAALMQYATEGIEGVIDYTDDLQRIETSHMLGERLDALAGANGKRRKSASGRTVLNDVLEHELQTRFVGEYMPKVDGATMHFGIEGRAPFLDQRIWDFAGALPFGIRLRHGRLKAVLRRLAADEIGRSVSRRKKRGFDIPVQRWIVGRWRRWAEDLLCDSILETEGWLRRGWAPVRLRMSAKTGTAPLQVWYAVILEAWMRHERRSVVAHT